MALKEEAESEWQSVWGKLFQTDVCVCVCARAVLFGSIQDSTINYIILLWGEGGSFMNAFQYNFIAKWQAHKECSIAKMYNEMPYHPNL